MLRNSYGLVKTFSLESRLGNFGEFIVIRLSRARLAQFIAALSAMVRALILTEDVPSSVELQ